MAKELEEGGRLQLDFDKIAKVAASSPGVIPAVAQDADSGSVLIIGYVNQTALETAQREQKAVFWSTSRNELWIKGATSGDYLDLVDIRVNCEQNAILYRVRPRTGAACHTRDAAGNFRPTCFYRVLEGDALRHLPESAQGSDHE